MTLIVAWTLPLAILLFPGRTMMFVRVLCAVCVMWGGWGGWGRVVDKARPLLLGLVQVSGEGGTMRK